MLTKYLKDENALFPLSGTLRNNNPAWAPASTYSV